MRILLITTTTVKPHPLICSVQWYQHHRPLNQSRYNLMLDLSVHTITKGLILAARGNVDTTVNRRFHLVGQVLGKG
jgi:hypothetical protein